MHYDYHEGNLNVGGVYDSYVGGHCHIDVYNGNGNLEKESG